jgi:hypothetical protein
MPVRLGPRVLAVASSRSRTWISPVHVEAGAVSGGKNGLGESPSPARESRALPRKQELPPSDEDGSSGFLDLISLLGYGTWLPDFDFTKATSPALIEPFAFTSVRKLLLVTA